MTDPDVEQLLMEAEAKWSTGEDDDAAALLHEALVTVWGRPDEVARVSETANRLAAARESEPVSEVARRAAAGARALEPFSTPSSRADLDVPTSSSRRRGYLGLIQLAIFTVVVFAILVVQYLQVVR